MHDHLCNGNYKAWCNYSGRTVENSGQQEILNWMGLVGALDALDRKAKQTGFVDSWIFNSSKTFLIAPPN